MDSLMPQMLALMPPMISSMKTMRGLSLTMYQTMSATINQMAAMNDTAIVMGQSFDTAKNDALFYLPPEAFQNPEFQRGLVMFLSPDGKSARYFITHQEDPMTPAGIARVGAERTAAQAGLKMSSLSDAKVYLGGTAATFKDMADGTKYDLMIAVVSALTLIFLIMLILTRSLVAALVIVGTAGSSIAASFGLSVLIWQDVFGINIHWLVMLMSVMILLAVGADYNLLLVSRFKEEIHAGLKTGYIRAMAGTGGVVTCCGPGVRRHHGLHARQQSAHYRAAGFHHRHRTAARHADRAHAADALDRHTAGTVVLVAASYLPPRRPQPAPDSAADRRHGHDPAAPRGRDESPRTAMRLAKVSVLAMVTAAMVALAASTHADPDTDFDNQLHGYGIYGPLDYNAWLGKITCERLHNGLDTTADKSAHFALVNLPRGATTAQSYQFLAAAISTSNTLERSTCSIVCWLLVFVVMLR